MVNRRCYVESARIIGALILKNTLGSVSLQTLCHVVTSRHMNVSEHFSANYQEARSKFVSLCQAHGFALEALTNERAEGPDGGDLVMDVAVRGDADASRLVVLFSGTHGVEGYCGSGIQNALVAGGCFDDLPENVRIALVHAVNPYGFAHNRRVNEDNIDLNRNFLDFGSEVPSDNGYGDLHEFLVPEQWAGEVRNAADAALAQYAKYHGAGAFQHAVSGGQYTHNEGLFYGGAAASWSAQTVLSVITELAAQAEHAYFIDFHTGLGPYGFGEIIAAGYPEQVSRTFAFYHDFELTDPDAGTSSSAPVQGTMAHGAERALPGVTTHFIALEYGTLPMKDVMTALRADNWLYVSGAIDDQAVAKPLKRQVRDAFYCDEDKWKSMVYERALDVVESTMHKLRG